VDLVLSPEPRSHAPVDVVQDLALECRAEVLGHEERNPVLARFAPVPGTKRTS
jgi:hypothetical protein